MPLTYWMAAYALVFFGQNKMSYLRGHLGFLDRLLECAYCCGFWAGWAVWFASWFIEGDPVFAAVPQAGMPGLALAGTAWAFSSATFCYAVEVLLKHLEGEAE